MKSQIFPRFRLYTDPVYESRDEIIRELAARLKQAVEYLEHPDVTAITDRMCIPSLTCAAHCREAIAHAEGPVSQHFEKFE